MDDLPRAAGPALMGDGHQVTGKHLRRVGSGSRRIGSGGTTQADRLACEAWNKRMLGFQGPAQPSPTLGDALNAGFGYLEVKCLGCNTHQTVALDIVRRPKTTQVHELERYMRCRECSAVRRYAFKRSQLIALRPNKITAETPPSELWRGDRG